MTAVGQHLLQSFGLRDGTWETIEDDSLVILAETIVHTGQDVNHEFVGNQLSLINISLGSLAQFRTVLDFTAQHVTRGDVSQTILCNQPIALGALS